MLSLYLRHVVTGLTGLVLKRITLKVSSSRSDSSTVALIDTAMIIDRLSVKVPMLLSHNSIAVCLNTLLDTGATATCSSTRGWLGYFANIPVLVRYWSQHLTWPAFTYKRHPFAVAHSIASRIHDS